MAKAAKIIGTVLAALAVLLTGAAMLVQTQWAREKLEHQLTQRLDGREVHIAGLDIDWGVPLSIRAEGIKVANPDWAEQPYMLELDALRVKLDVGALLAGNLSLRLLALDAPEIHLARRADGQSNWASLTGNDDPDDGGSPIRPEAIRIENGQLTYRDEALDAELTLDIETTSNGGQRRLIVEGKGDVQGKPLSLKLTGEPPAQAVTGDSPYAVTLDARLGDIRATFDGGAAELPALDELHGRLTVKAPQSTTLQSFSHPAVDIPGSERNPRLQHDSSGGSHLRYDAPEQNLWIEVSANSTASGLNLQGSAERNQVPLSFEADVGPLRQLFTEAPFPIQARLTSRQTRFEIDGTVADPLDSRVVNARISLKGPNPARLNPLTGLDLPSLAPYQLNGQLVWEKQALRLQDFRAKLGESDLSGDVRLDLDGRPMLWATLHSDKLVTEDLKAPGTPTDPGDGQVFSDEPLGLDGLRSLDAFVRYDADNVNAEDIPLNSLDLNAELNDGVLVVEPLTLSIGQGKAKGRLTIDVRPEPPTGQAHLSVTGMRLSPILRKADFPQIAQDSAGTLGGKLDLHFDGSSLGAIAADLEGKLELAMSGGKLDMLAVELLGLDAGEAAVAALVESDQVDMNCTYVRFDSDQGVAKLEQLLISTRDSNITGGGTIQLDSEKLDLTFKAHAKDFSLLSGNSPVQLTGTLTNPQVSVVTDELMARALASLAGALIAPPLAILPWIEAGLGEGSGIGCRKALDEFEQGG